MSLEKLVGAPAKGKYSIVYENPDEKVHSVSDLKKAEFVYSLPKAIGMMSSFSVVSGSLTPLGGGDCVFTPKYRFRDDNYQAERIPLKEKEINKIQKKLGQLVFSGYIFENGKAENSVVHSIYLSGVYLRIDPNCSATKVNLGESSKYLS